MSNVSESERNTEHLKKSNDELRSRLQELKMDQDENAQDGDIAPENKFTDEDIVEMKMRMIQ